MAGAGFGDMDFECLQFSMASVALLTCISNFHGRRRIWWYRHWTFNGRRGTFWHGSSIFMAGAGFGGMDFECLQFSMAGVALFDMGLQSSWQAQDLVIWIWMSSIFNGRCGTFDMYLQLSWQAQDLVIWTLNFQWQAWHFLTWVFNFPSPAFK